MFKIFFLCLVSFQSSFTLDSNTTTTAIPFTNITTSTTTETTTTTPTTTTTTIKTTTPTPTKDIELKSGVPLLTSLTAKTPLSLTIQGPIEPSHAFWIFEAHSQYYQIGLSTNFPKIDKKFQFKIGNHPGVVLLRNESALPPRVFLTTKSKQNVTVLLLVRGYSSNNPVPGLDKGPLEISDFSNSLANPALNLTWDNHIVRLQFPESGYLDNITWKSDQVFRYEVYQMYLDEHDFDEINYLTRLASFLLPKDIRSSGHLVSDTFVRRNLTKKQNEVIFGAYPGSAAIFTVIATTSRASTNGSEVSYTTVYVASSTYSCHLDESMPYNCKVMWLTITKVVCAFSVFVGLFVALMGHRQFQITQFFYGIFAGYFIGYIIVEKYTGLDFSGTLGLSAGISVLAAIIWSCLWFFCGIPIIATVLPLACMGLLFGSILVYLPVLNIASLTNDTTYWAIVGSFTLGTPLVLLSFTKTASILSCAVVGTFAIITPLDHYIGSSLKYILVNVIRRATVKDFNFAVIYFPFQVNDIALSLGWIAMILISYFVQKCREKNRAPFPPNMYQQWRWRREEMSFRSQNEVNMVTESTPLLRPRMESPPRSPSEHIAYRSPVRFSAPRTARTPIATNTPVVGYIEARGTLVASPAIRAFQLPEFYEGRAPPTTTTTTVKASAPPRRSQNTPSQSILEDSDIFRPPDDHTNQTN